MAGVNPIPDNYPRLSPYLYVNGAADAIAFYEKVLGAETRGRMDGPDGRVGHAELTLGDSVLMLADENPDMGVKGPKTIGGSPMSMHVYVEDADATYAAAIEAGATSLREVEDQFYGDRSGQFEDPFGHRWNVATHIEDVSPEEMVKRAAEAMAGG